MHSFKRTLSAIIICALVVVILAALDFALYPCTFIRNDIHRVVTQTFDDVYLGTSHGKLNIDPEAAESVSGRTGHNLCVGGEYPVDAYYMLKLMIEKGHAPERVIYEASPGYFVKEKEEGNNYLLFIHEFPPTKALASYYADVVSGCNFRTTLFPWYEYDFIYELKRIKETVVKKWTKDYSPESFTTDTQQYHENGFVERYPVSSDDFSLDGVDRPDITYLNPDNVKYLIKLIELCRDNGIRFAAITTPVPDATIREYAQDYAAFDSYFTSLFAAQNVPYYNFNGQYAQAASHDPKDYTDLDGHMNGEAARTFSKTLAAILEKS